MTTMKNPPHPGSLLADEIEFLGWSVAEAAKRIGVSRQQLHNVISGKSAVSAEMALRFELGVSGTARHWLAMQAAYDLAQVSITTLKVEPRPMTAAE
jgi:addiction module HigA family antidote